MRAGGVAPNAGQDLRSCCRYELTGTANRYAIRFGEMSTLRAVPPREVPNSGGLWKRSRKKPPGGIGLTTPVVKTPPGYPLLNSMKPPPRTGFRICAAAGCEAQRTISTAMKSPPAAALRTTAETAPLVFRVG